MNFPFSSLSAAALALTAAALPTAFGQEQDQNQPLAKSAPRLQSQISAPLSTPSIPSTQSTNLPALAAAALKGDSTAIQSLRDAGPAGLNALLTAAAPVLDSLRACRTRLDDPVNTALRTATDAVARQRDAWASGLYWFTDLDAARTEARRTGRPILSLRLLGNLDEEYSCANSRFFRTVLYANPEVSRTLREKFVLHWKSVRPAPLLTIDMGDGRRIKRTITGNSIHYLLNSDGRVLDALPGLYSPQAFLNALDRAAAATGTTAGFDPITGAHIISTTAAAGNGENHPTPADIRAWHGREAHDLCLEWLDAAVDAGAYDQDPRLSPSEAEGGESDPAVRLARLVGAFPSLADSPGPPMKALLFPSRPLRERQHARFGLPDGEHDSDMASGGPERQPDAADPVRKVEFIREFPFPTEFDPPKAMVERPVLQKSLPDSDAVPAQDPASPAPAPVASATTAEPSEPTADTALEEQPAAAEPDSSGSESEQPRRRWEVIREVEFPYPTEFDPPQIPKAMVERPILQKSIPGSDALPAQDPASPLPAEPDAVPAPTPQTEIRAKPQSKPASPPAPAPVPVPAPLADRMTPALWSRIAKPLSATVRLDEASRRFMVQKLPIEILTKNEAATGQPLSAHSPFGRQLARFEAAIARDMVRNEYWYHNRIHQWLEEDEDGNLTHDVEALNSRVYRDLFLTPDYDAWLGLVPEDTYTALEKDGCACDRMENHLKAR